MHGRVLVIFLKDWTTWEVGGKININTRYLYSSSCLADRTAWNKSQVSKHFMSMTIKSLKATVENPRGSVEKLSPNLGCRHCAEGQCEGSRGVFRGQTLGCKTGTAPKVLKLRVCLRKIPREPSHCPAPQCQHPRRALSWGDSYSTLPQGFSTVAQTTNFMRFIGKWS